MDNKTIQHLPDGTLIVSEPIPGGHKTIRYFDSRLQLKLNIVEKTVDKTVLTKYMPDGRTVQSITVETKNGTQIFKADGKTLEREKELFPNGSWQEIVYQPNGQTIRQMAFYQPDGTARIVLYQADGVSVAQEIEQNNKGLSKTRYFASNGQTLLKTVEDLSDGSTRTVLFNDLTGVIVSVSTGPLKGEAEPNVYKLEEYDSSGKEVVSVTKVKH